MKPLNRTESSRNPVSLQDHINRMFSNEAPLY
jgi:hypothetical protein